METPATLRALTAGPLIAALDRDLRGPLSGVLAMADLLGRRTLPDDAAACLRSLREDAERLERILACARDLVCMAEGGVDLRHEAFSVRGLMDELQARWAGAGEGGTTLLASYEGDGELSACGDPDRLVQIFDALVARAAGEGRGAVEAALCACVVGDRVKLTGRVRDDGTASAGSVGGVGLALAEALVAQMGGRLSAEENIGAGGTVTFELALHRSMTDVQSPVAAGSGTSPLHVLIVDDNATNRLVAEAFCDMFGCTSDSAEDGVEALEAISVRRYDVVLMDVKMPRMDGIEATRAIRALPGPERDTPIVALTANADPDDVRQYIAAGMMGVVEKPIKADRLAEALNAATSEAVAEATLTLPGTRAA